VLCAPPFALGLVVSVIEFDAKRLNIPPSVLCNSVNSWSSVQPRAGILARIPHTSSTCPQLRNLTFENSAPNQYVSTVAQHHFQTFSTYPKSLNLTRYNCLKILLRRAKCFTRKPPAVRGASHLRQPSAYRLWADLRRFRVLLLCWNFILSSPELQPN
jgi:hypothetical protein